MAYPGGFSGCPETPPGHDIFLIHPNGTLTGTDLHQPPKFVTFGNPPETNSGYATEGGEGRVGEGREGGRKRRGDYYPYSKDLENRRKMNKLTVLYKIRNNLLCIKENGYFERADSLTRDASRNYKLKSAKTELFKHSFFINTPKIWNKLPIVIKDAQFLESFKIAIRKHYQ